MHAQPNDLPTRSLTKSHSSVYNDFYQHSSAPRVNTDAYIIEIIRKEYPALHVTATVAYNVNILGFAASGNASATPVDADNAIVENLKWRMYQPPASRIHGESGFLTDSVQFGKYLYKWEDKEYIVYSINGSDGLISKRPMIYLLGASAVNNDLLLLAAGKYAFSVHDSVLVFDGGYWQESTELWRAVQDAHWSDVILDEQMKKSVVGEITKFFDSRSRYQRLRVPWKRGLIFHGPPGIYHLDIFRREVYLLI